MAKAGRKAAGAGLEGSVTHLLQRAVRVALDFHAEAAGASAVTQRQYTVLAAAGAKEGQNQNDLVRATGIDRSTLAELVSRMLSKGLLERERSTTDARANAVSLSTAGRAALAEGAGAAAAADARLLGLLAPKKRDSLMKILASVSGAADHGGEPAAPAPRKAEKGRKKKKKKAAKAAKAAKASAARDIGA
jgi:DNA-binding MarR family transcriptional regulator